MSVLPYSRQTITDRDVRAVATAIGAPYLTQGPHVAEFECRLADYVEAKFAVAFSSGTAALHAAAHVAGVDDGARYITTPISFVATANAALYCGMRPRFVDITPSGNLDSARAAAVAAGFVGTVVAPVSLAGLPANLWPLQHSIVIEDACHALGAVRNGRKVGADADMTVFSFHPVKTITTGEGGAVVTNREDWAEALRDFRSHGIRTVGPDDDPLHGGWHRDISTLGHNYRITDFQCALGSEQLKRIDRFVDTRNRIAERYRELLNLDEIALPAEAPSGSLHAYHLFVVRFREGADRRRTVYEHLRARGIATQVHYIPIPTLTLYRRMGYQMAQMPEAQAYWEEALSLPIFPTMGVGDVGRVVQQVVAAMQLPVDAWRATSVAA